MKRITLTTCLLFLILIEPVKADNIDSQLKCKITIPKENSIIRGQVPVYGYAEGIGFKEYILEYGAGEAPKDWILISKGSTEQKVEKAYPKLNFALEKTISGNIGLWDTGLTEYEYEEQKVDLSPGVYTLKLVATNDEGNRVEDRITLEVGRVFLNSVGGTETSSDGKASFYLPEHALSGSSEVISLKSLPQASSLPIEAGFKQVSSIYELNPPGMEFFDIGILSIKYDESLDNIKNALGIYRYDPTNSKWDYQESALDIDNRLIKAMIERTQDKFSVYVLGYSTSVTNVPYREQIEILDDSTGPALYLNTFESNMDQWSNKYGYMGARLTIEKSDDSDQGNCLKITAQTKNGNNACQIRRNSFDASKFKHVSFDYKIPEGFKTNFYVKTGSKWYDIVFTDIEKVYWDVNMDKIGKIKNIKTDNKWHHAEFDLYEMLKGKTTNYIVKEIIMADWDITAFMKLENGHNRVNSSYYIDNFSINSN